MDDTRELISIPAFNQWLIAAAAIVLVTGLAAGWTWGRRNGVPRAGLARGVAAGLLGPAALGLWGVYNLLEDHYGLDTVAALLLNLAIFVIAGAAAGSLVQRTWRATAPAQPADSSDAEVGKSG